MSYTIKKLADLAGVSVRTLQYYDDIGLLNPSRVKSNDYRQYGETELLKLQQILFFRELDFPLLEIKKIISSSHFNMQEALKDQRKLIELKKDRLQKLIATIDKTIKKINKETTMEDTELYGDFSEKEMNAYAKEAKEKWGDTDAWRQSQERTKNFTKADYARIQKAGEEWAARLATFLGTDPKSEHVQVMIAEHYNGLRTFYEPNLELYRGLADMYVADERFKKNYEKHAVGLAEFLRAAMIHYIETHK